MISNKSIQFLCLVLTLPALGYATTVYFPVLSSLPLTVSGLAVLLYAITLYRILHNTFASPLRALPYAPEDTLVFGHTLKILERPSVETLLRWMRNTSNEGMLRVSDFFHAKSGVLVTSPAVAYEILTVKASKFHKPSHVRNWLLTLLGSGGIITAEGHEHTVQRKALTRIFTNTATLDLVPLFWSKSCRLVDIISERLASQQSASTAEEKVLAGDLDLAPLSAGITLDIISIAIFGRDLDCVSNELEPMHRAWSFLANPDTSNGALNTYFVACALLPMWLTGHFPNEFVRQFNMHRQALRKLCTDILTERREDPEKDTRKDILSLMIQAESKTESAEPGTQIVDQMLTFLAAGHDTTSGTFLWAMWLMSQNLDAQTRVRKEVQSLLVELRESGEEFTGHSLDKLPYTTAVANEAMRLFPTVALTVRDPQEDVEIGGVMIPKGTPMYISPWAMQRMPETWGADVDEFRPERWLHADDELDHTGGALAQHAFLTFLNGNRSCIGQHFARNELRCLIAALLNKFEVTKLPGDAGDLNMSGIITVQPKDGMKVHLTEIQA